MSSVDSDRPSAGAPPRLGHHAVVPPRTGIDPPPVEPAVLDELRGWPVTDVSDCVGRLYTMDPAIRPLFSPMRRVAGVALTVKAPPGDNWAIHGGLGRAFPGSVLVVDWRGHTGSCGGGARMLVPAIERGLDGLVIDGAWRDVEEVAEAGLPIHGRGVAAFSPGKRELGEINVPVCCGGVVVEPGDLVVADAGGVAVVPRRDLATVLAALRAASAGAAAEGTDVAVRRIGEAYHQAVAEVTG